MKRGIECLKAKKTVDIAMILMVIVSWWSAERDFPGITRWCSSHCIVGIVLLLLIIMHIMQHWRFIVALTKKKVFLKNKITAFTGLVFLLMAVSILLFVVGFRLPFLKLHNVIGHFFMPVVIIHVIDKFKKFTTFFRQ